MSLQASVIICSHNPRPHCLERTLAALRTQTLPSTAWELILVDNGSAPPLAAQWDISWHPGAKHLTEPRLGLTHARLAGIRAAKAPLLIFLDDDNVPASDFLAQATRIADECESIGVFGAGVIKPEFEVTPDPNLEPYLSFLAVRSVGQSLEKLDPTTGPLPCGAGLCVRAEVARRYDEAVTACPIRSVLGRTGTRLLSGEDDEFSWAAQAMGLRHAIRIELCLLHLIEGRRVEVSYLEELIHGSGYSSALLAKAHGRPDHNPYALPSFASALAFAKRRHLLLALIEIYRLIKHQGRSPLTRRFATALADGWDKGIADYHSKIAPLIPSEPRPSP